MLTIVELDKICKRLFRVSDDKNAITTKSVGFIKNIVNIEAVSNMALQTAIAICKSKTAPAASKVAASRLLLEVVGLVGAGRRQAATRDMHELSAAELRQMVGSLQREIAERAAPVSEPINLSALE